MSAIGEKIAAEVNRLAAENPDFIYDTDEDKDQCVYVENGEPSCLYGYALWNLGLIDARIEKATMTIGGRLVSVNHQTIKTLARYLGLNLDQEELWAFSESQDYQDSSRPWYVAARPLAKLS
ncbi:hypothetical protein [Mycobacterium sp. CnD-18-1]|uniref:hypothetical protein n=1 Tax=Mycobacterium sp. CnD-18-1 TaxID=2917744 RepID=UPI001EF1B9AA|nr:hypothetical protein [Mycobacterium sp. CnD-18-1]MCG7607167.1 hypothetical protein [Mycobacterium sp. CnD-18-1]